MDGYKLVMDVSHHVTLDYDLVKKYVDGFIIRFGFGTLADRLADRHYEGLKEKPCAGYQWFRPDQDIKAQIELVKVKTAGKDIRVFFSDQEQPGVYNTTTVYTPEVLSERGRAHVEGLALHGFDMGVYTRATWISQYSRPMLNWITGYHMWLASWPYDRTVVRSTWEYLMSNWAPKLFKPYYTAEFLTEHRKTQAWQWSGDKFIVPGVFTNPDNPMTNPPIPRTSDFNFVSDALFDRFKTGAVVPPVVVTPTDPHPALMDAAYNEMYDLKTRMVNNLAGELVELEAAMKILKG